MKKALISILATIGFSTGAIAVPDKTPQWGYDTTAPSGTNLQYKIGTTWTPLSTSIPRVSVFSFMSSAEVADVQSNTASLDVSTSLTAALNSCTNGSRYAIEFPPGTYGVKNEVKIRTCAVDILLDAGAIVKQTAGFGGNLSIRNKSIFNFVPTSGLVTSNGSTISGSGIIDGNRANLISDYLAIPNRTQSGTYVKSTEWNCISINSENNITIDGITTQNCMTYGIAHENGDNITVNNVKILSSSNAMYSQLGNNVTWTNIYEKDIQNQVSGITIPWWQYANIWTDVTNYKISNISLDGYFPLFKDGTSGSPGSTIGDPNGGAFTILRSQTGIVSGLSAKGLQYSDGRAKPTSWGFQCDSCTSSNITNVDAFGFYWGAMFQSPSSVSFSNFTLDGDWNTSVVAGAFASTGIWVRPYGHVPQSGTTVSTFDHYTMQQPIAFSISNGTSTRFTHGMAAQASNYSISNVNFVANENVGALFWKTTANSSFPSASKPLVSNIIMDGISANYNGGNGFLYNDGINILCNGCVANNNGQLFSTTFGASGIILNSSFGDAKTNIQNINWQALDTQSFTNSKILSFIPGVATDNTYSLVASNQNNLNVGQNIICVACGSGASNINGYIKDITYDYITIKTSGAPTFDDSSCKTTLTGTISANAGDNFITGNGTLFSTEIIGPVYLSAAGQYLKIGQVVSNTTLLSDTTVVSSIPAGTSAYLVQCDAQGIPSQKVGFSAKLSANITNVTIGDPSQYLSYGNTTANVDYASNGQHIDWTDYTPTVTFTAGTNPSYLARGGRYKIDGKTMCLNAYARVTYTAPGYPTQVIFSLPTDASGNQYKNYNDLSLVGTNGTDFTLLYGSMLTNATSIALESSSATPMFSAPDQYVGFSGCFEIQ